jgi:hypothetical protein
MLYTNASDWSSDVCSSDLRLHSDSVSVKHNNIQFKTNLSIIERNIYNYVKVPLVLDDTLKGLLACRINSVISFEQVINAFSIFDKCIDKIKGDLKNEEMQEIKRYLLSHKLNILIQVNKKRFKALGFKNIPFFIKSGFCMNFDQFFLLFRKLRS